MSTDDARAELSGELRACRDVEAAIEQLAEDAETALQLVGRVPFGADDEVAHERRSQAAKVVQLRMLLGRARSDTLEAEIRIGQDAARRVLGTDEVEA